MGTTAWDKQHGNDKGKILPQELQERFPRQLVGEETELGWEAGLELWMEGL